jgi:hypothetical protein
VGVADWCWVPGVGDPGVRATAHDSTTRIRVVRYPNRVRTIYGRGYNPYERPMTSSMISSLPAPIRFRRRSRHERSIPYSFM